MKRVRLVGKGDIWTGYVVEVDGKPLPVRSASLGIAIDEMNTVTLVLDATDVEVDIQS